VTSALSILREMKGKPFVFRPFRNATPMSAAEVIASLGASKEDIAAVEAILGFPVPRLPVKRRRPKKTAPKRVRRAA
jgi:hypothetical protein